MSTNSARGATVPRAEYTVSIHTIPKNRRLHSIHYMIIVSLYRRVAWSNTDISLAQSKDRPPVFNSLCSGDTHFARETHR